MSAPTVPTVSVRQAAAFLGIGVESVREEVRKGTLPGFVFGKRPQIRVDRARLTEMAGYPADYDFDFEPGAAIAARHHR